MSAPGAWGAGGRGVQGVPNKRGEVSFGKFLEKNKRGTLIRDRDPTVVH